MPRGGYQKPSNPAPVSNPRSGARTDGSPVQAAKYMAGGSYGEGKQLQELQTSAPMAAKQTTRISGSSAAANVAGMPPITRLDAPTERPNEPMTNGMPFGPGAGPEALAVQRQASPLSSTMAKLIQYDTTGELNELYDYLISRGL